jgi:hypothetical protein
MRRNTRKNVSDAGSDAFLDIVANMVGILIILVMVVGVQVKAHTSIPVEQTEEQQQKLDEVMRLSQSSETLEKDVLALTSEISRVQAEANLRGTQRDQVAYLVAAGEKVLQERSQKLNNQQRADLEIAQQLDHATKQHDQLQRALQQTSHQKKQSVEIETYPTPISYTVDDQEAHLQIRGGRIAVLPVDALLRELKSDAREQVWKLKKLPEVTATVGPIDGFRMRYRLERVMLPPDPEAGRPVGGSFVRLDQWTLIPVSGQLGETLDEALAQNSALRRYMDTINSQLVTVTLWVYPDSFEAYRKLKKELYQMGFAAAGRPLPEGMPIGGSRNGSKSAAQ